MAEAARSDQAVDQDEETPDEKIEPLDKWLLALKEDLASWISRLLKMKITVDIFTKELDTGVVLCKLANFIQNTGEKFRISNPKCKVVLARAGAKFKERGALRGSFIARDNVCNFIRWCREIGVPDVIMFETEDLVSNKNEKAVLLTLLEVARRVFKVGVDPPELVRLENEIDKELQNEPEQPKAEPILTVLKKKHKSHSLDDLVFEVQKKCSCPTRYPVQRISDGKYRMGESKNLIFVRVMRKHVMVRVGGGWDTLDRYFEKHDPCRLVAHRRPSKASRPSSAGQQLDDFVRSPSSTSMASLSSTESYESTGTASSIMSATQPVGGKRSPRSRTLSGGTNSPTFDRCLSPRRGSHSRHKSPCNRSTPPRTIHTQGRSSNISKSQSMQDLQQRRGSEPVGLSSSLPVPRRRPSSAHRPSTAPGSQASTSTSGQRRRSVAVTPRRDGGSSTQATKQQPSKIGTTGSRMHHRSKSMQDLNKASLSNKANTPTASPRKSRPSSAKPRTSSATPDRSRSEGPRNAAPSSRRASTSQVSRKHSNSVSCESPRRRPPITGSPISSPRITRRSSSTPRGTTGSPVSSPRISRRKSSTPKDVTLVNRPDPMRRAISNLSSPPTRRVSRSASFGSKDDLSKQILSNGTGKLPSPRQQGMSGIPRPKGTTKPSKVPIKVPGKQSPAKKKPVSSSTYVSRSKKELLSNGTPHGSPVTSKGQHYPPPDPYEDIPTPFDNYSYTSEETSSLLSDKDELCLIPNDFCVGFDSTDSTPDTVKTLDSSYGLAGDGLSTSEYDYLDCESDLSGIKSPRSVSSGYSFGPSPTKELLDPSDFILPLTEESEEIGNVGILERLKSLQVEQSSVRPTLRGKIFTEQTTPQQPSTAFSASEYMQKEPEDRSKFFDIEKEFPMDGPEGRTDPDYPESPRKFSLVHALIGSIEKRNDPPQTPKKKRTDSLEGENQVSILSEQPTETCSGSEAVTGSRGGTPEESEIENLQETIREESPSDLHKALDENDNLPNNRKTAGTGGEQETNGEGIHQDEQLQGTGSGVETTGSPKHKELSMDSYPRTQQIYSLEEMIEDMSPTKDSGKEPAFQAII